jgi:hypothetical protein
MKNKSKKSKEVIIAALITGLFTISAVFITHYLSLDSSNVKTDKPIDTISNQEPKYSNSTVTLEPNNDELKKFMFGNTHTINEATSGDYTVSITTMTYNAFQGNNSHYITNTFLEWRNIVFPAFLDDRLIIPFKIEVEVLTGFDKDTICFIFNHQGYYLNTRTNVGWLEESFRELGKKSESCDCSIIQSSTL